MTTRDTEIPRNVTAAMSLLRAALPILRPLLLAIFATLLILVGLPALLAAQAAASL